jgi:hypothetical protein
MSHLLDYITSQGFKVGLRDSGEVFIHRGVEVQRFASLGALREYVEAG